MNTDKNLTTKRILIYLGITFSMTYAYEFGVVYPAAFSKNPTLAGLASLLISPAMLMPALGVLLTRIITKEGFHWKEVWIAPNFKGHIRYYLIGWFAPAILTLIGMGIYFLIFPENFDGNMTLLQQMTAAAGQELPAEALKITLLAQLAVGFLFAPLLNFLFCFGEEWGWRGYLLPKMMEKYSIGKVLLINGIIWGLWHAPITAIGHNYRTGYPGWPVTGILAMCGFCLVMGTIFSYITIKTGSCLPAAFAHGSLNGIAGFGMYFAIEGGNPFVGPAPTGIIGGSAFIVVAIIMAVILIKNPKATESNSEP